jgi:hypothetical protein
MMDPDFFSFLVARWKGTFSFFPLFLMFSHQVSKGFLEMFLIAPLFYGYGLPKIRLPYI